MGGGQMVAADFIMTPSVVFSENNAGGVGGAVGGLLGGKAARGRRRTEVQGSADQHARGRFAVSGVQVAAAEGSTKKADMRLGGAFFGGGGGAVGRRLRQHERRQDHRRRVHGQLQQGREASFAAIPSLQRNVGTLKQEAAAGGRRRPAPSSTKATSSDRRSPNVKLMAEPSDTAKVVATLGRGDELVVIGGEKDGYVKVQGSTASGWVKVVLVNKR